MVGVVSGSTARRGLTAAVVDAYRRVAASDRLIAVAGRIRALSARDRGGWGRRIVLLPSFHDRALALWRREQEFVHGIEELPALRAGQLGEIEQH